MEEQNKNTLRQADAVVIVEGLLAEKNLELTKDSEGKDIIKGNLVIRVTPTNSITLNVYVNKFIKSGEANKAYAGMLTVMNEYQSIADVGEELATKVRCKRGQLQPNSYIDKRSGDVRVGIRYGASFVTRVDENSKIPYEPTAKFEVEGYVRSIVKEMDKGEETGRLRLNILVPTYSSIEPMEIIVGDDWASDLESAYEVGQTGRFFGELRNNVVVKEEVIKMGIGKSEVRKSLDYTDERVFTGASEPYEEENAYATEAIQIAMADREMKLDDGKKKAAEARQTANKASIAANQSASGRTFKGFTM